jgi:recombinational DNA repair protein (RecF pathway)
MKRREYTTPEQKREIMRKAGLEPQEDFVHKDRPWRSICLVCGKEVSPRFGSIRSGQGGCKYCAGVALIEEVEAKKIMQARGLEPLEAYVNSKTPWKASCNKCGHVNSPTLANVKWRNVGCKACAEVSRAEQHRLTEEEVISSLLDVGLTPIGDLSYEDSKKPIPARCVACSRVVAKSVGDARQGSGCPYCSNKRVDPVEAHEFMLTNGAKPLVNYPSSTSPWQCICTTCQREITPTYGAVKSGQSPCAYCAGKKVDLQEAQELLKKKKLLPLVPYPGSSKQWRCECLICGRETSPSYANLRSGSGGCMNCAGKYLDPEEAVQRMQKAGLSPLVPYVSRHTPWLSKCLECER